MSEVKNENKAIDGVMVFITVIIIAMVVGMFLGVGVTFLIISGWLGSLVHIGTRQGVGKDDAVITMTILIWSCSGFLAMGVTTLMSASNMFVMGSLIVNLFCLLMNLGVIKNGETVEGSA